MNRKTQIFFVLVLSEVKEFLPDFAKNTEALLKNEGLLKRKRIEEEGVFEKKPKTKLKRLQPPSNLIYKTGSFFQATDIKLVFREN